MASGVGTAGDAKGDTFTDVENLEVSAHNDVLTGDSGANTLKGGGGHDTLKGGTGYDTASYDGASSGATADLANDGNNAGAAAGDTFSGGNDVIYGDGDYDDNDGMDNDVLDGGAGDDELIGEKGDDTYKFGRGGGSDTIDNRGQAASNDKVLFDAGIDADQLWLEQAGAAWRDLKVSIVGTDDSVVVEDWFNGSNNTLDFELSDGRRLVETGVQRLVQAMSTMVKPGGDASEWTTDQRETLDPLVTAWWRPPPTG